ncbi:MAG: response regulator [Chitinophagaceae bacterium]|nr:MAG: response regulator [Chitinophagaceae bacterium]
MSSFTILMADDDQDDQMILRDSIVDISTTAELQFAMNGEEAMTLLEQGYVQQRLPMLIVLDLNMPLMNGPQTLAAIKNDARFDSIPVIIYSTSINRLEKEKCLRLGAQAYWVKPISYQESRTIAQKFLEACGGPH